jgi:hypothetical protein
VRPEADEAEIKVRPSISSGLSFAPYVFYREVRPPTPRLKATVCAVTRGNIAELAATAFVALFIALLSVRTIGYRGEQCSGGEGVSQSLLKDQVFLTFLGQNPPFELRENWRFASNLFMKSMAAHPSAALQFPSAVDSRVGWRLPLKAKHLARFRRFFPILSMGLGRQEDSRYFSATTYQAARQRRRRLQAIGGLVCAAPTSTLRQNGGLHAISQVLRERQSIGSDCQASNWLVPRTRRLHLLPLVLLGCVSYIACK